MSLGDAVYAGLTGRTPQSRGATSLPQLLALAEAVAGGPTKAARYVGVGYATWKRWKNGTNKPSAVSRGKLEIAERHARMSPARVAELQRDGFTLTGERLDRPGAKRHIRAAEGPGAGLRLAPGTIDRILGHYYDGDDQGAAEELVDGTQDDFYGRYLDPFTDDGVIEGDEGYFGTVF